MMIQGIVPEAVARALPPSVSSDRLLLLHRSNHSAQVMMAAFFGLVGYALYKLDFELAPLALGFVLGRLFEEKLRQSLIISDGSPLTFL